MFGSKRIERDGKVAILIHPSYGGGWTTWGLDLRVDTKFDPLTDPIIVAHVLGEKPITDAQCWAVANRYEHHMFPLTRYSSDLEFDYEIDISKSEVIAGVRECIAELAITWIPIGQRFRIEEYDGSESVDFFDESSYRVFN